MSRSVSVAPDVVNVERPEHHVSFPNALLADSAGFRRTESDQLILCSPSDAEALLQKRLRTPLPKLQLAAVCLVRLADPLTFTQIFPYVNEMMRDLGVARTPSQVGFYSGLVESVFAVSQLLTIYPCARLSDVIGRRPVILVGIVGLALATFVFGLSKSFVAVLVTRCLAGALAGNVATIHAVLAEITDMSNVAVAFPVYGLCWPVGSIIGPLVGGTFSHPAAQFAVFKKIPFFTVYPYFLPCLICGLIALGGAALGYFYLEETLPSKRRELIGEGPSPDRIDTTKAYGTVNRTHAHQVAFENTSDSHGFSSSTDAEVGVCTLLAIPVVRALAISSLALSFVSGTFDVVFVLFCYSPITTGGLGYSATKIGYALAIAGTSAALFQLLVLPILLRRVAAVTAYKLCMKLWPVAFLMFPLLNVLARAGLEVEDVNTAGEVLKPAYTAAVWVGIGLCLATTRIANLAFSLSMILVKDTSPTPSALGAANGLAQFSMCIARAVAPAFVSALFAVSVDNHILGSYLWVCVMVLFACVGIRMTDRIEYSPENPTVDKAT
ncbi:MFS general substrate transporter [Gautieria morchelliformis]|nr:MFS general substrate transporter [Gautieria morchelliformis]